MTFIVEDGTLVINANSYVDVAFADDYFVTRMNATWLAIVDPLAKEAALVQATDYIENIYGRKFIGEMVNISQSLSWPRKDTDVYSELAYREDEIPLRLMKATCEYAVRASAAPLSPDPVIDATGLTVVTTRKAVGPIEKEFRPVAGRSTPALIRPYPAADAYMVGLLCPGGGRVIR